MIRYAVIALLWMVVFGGVAFLIAVIERRIHERKKQIYEQNFAGMGLDAPESDRESQEANDS